MIVCCFTKLRPETVESLAKYAPLAEFVNVWGEPFNYWRALLKHWDDKEDLIIVEHDMEIHENVIPEFNDCPSPWCTFPYDHQYEEGRVLTMSLGCTKLSFEARQLAPPEKLCKVKMECWTCHAGSQLEGLPACWMHIDAKLAAWLEHKDMHPCVHSPPVIHHGRSE
jgi:hypothetical protein